MALNAEAMQGIFDENNKRKKIQDIPLFFGTEKDSLTGRQLIDRIEAAGRVAATPWTGDRMIIELEHCLQDKSAVWFRAAKNASGNDFTVWANVKSEFLKCYDRAATIRTAPLTLEQLVIKPDEKVTDFYARMDVGFDLVNRVTPAEINTVLDGAELDGIALADLAARQAHVRALVTRKCKEQIQFLQQLMFTFALPEPIRIKVQEAGHTRLWDAYNTALQTEVLHSKKKSGVKINVVTENDEDEEGLAGEEPENEDHLNAINFARKRKGLPPKPRPAHFRRATVFTPGASRGARPTVDASKMTCRYCKQTGHMQPTCQARIRAGAPCVDHLGKPWRNQPKINDVQEDIAQVSSAALNSVRFA